SFPMNVNSPVSIYAICAEKKNTCRKALNRTEFNTPPTQGGLLNGSREATVSWVAEKSAGLWISIGGLSRYPAASVLAARGPWRSPNREPVLIQELPSVRRHYSCWTVAKIVNKNLHRRTNCIGVDSKRSLCEIARKKGQSG